MTQNSIKMATKIKVYKTYRFLYMNNEYEKKYIRKHLNIFLLTYMQNKNNLSLYVFAFLS